MDVSEKIIVALDTDIQQARKLASRLAGHAVWLKVGMTLYYAVGPGIISEFKAQGFKVFVDLKLHDIPHQLEGAASVLAAAGADMLTLHASGGQTMMEAARIGAEAGYALCAPKASEADSRESRIRPICLAVTVLTSLDDEALHSVGVGTDAATQVLRLAQLAQSAGLDGIVCSPLEVAGLRANLGPDLTLVCPGVRPAGADTADQARMATPQQALAAGADYLVIGRPITAAADPLAAFLAIAEI